MEIVVRGRHERVSSELRAAAEEKAGKAARFLRDISRIEVEFAAERNPRVANGEICDITVYVKGAVLTAHAGAADPGAALDLAVDKIEQQARKVHERRVSRVRPRRSRNNQTRDGLLATGVLGGGAVSEDSGNPDGSGARIVEVEPLVVKPMTPEEAALELDLRSRAFLLFNNSESGHAAVIYRRRDGDLGLIDAG